MLEEAGQSNCVCLYRNNSAVHLCEPFQGSGGSLQTKPTASCEADFVVILGSVLQSRLVGIGMDTDTPARGPGC